MSNWEVVWVDREMTPVIESTKQPVGGDVFATFTAAKAHALNQAMGGVRAMQTVAKEIRELRRADCS